MVRRGAMLVCLLDTGKWIPDRNVRDDAADVIDQRRVMAIDLLWRET